MFRALKSHSFVFAAAVAAFLAVSASAATVIVTVPGLTDIWLAGQPNGMHEVFPCNDHPSDKALFTFTLDVPRGWTAVANGVPTGRTDSGGRTVWRYRESHPLATELVQIAAGDLRVEALITEDWTRVGELVERYADLGLGGVDASVVALAERLGVHAIATLDRRHFTVVQPAHCDAFELLP